MSDVLKKEDLRQVFVAMIFALAIGEFAITGYDVYEAYEVFNTSPYASLGHLCVALCIIISSWVFWSQSFDNPSHPKFEQSPFSSYALLIVDIIIVAWYFILVKTIDEGAPSSLPEIRILIWIFALFLLWQAIISLHQWSGLSTFFKEICLDLCFMVIFIILYFCPIELIEKSLHDTEIVPAVIGIDACLCFLIIWYRVLQNKSIAKKSKTRIN